MLKLILPEPKLENLYDDLYIYSRAETIFEYLAG